MVINPQIIDLVKRSPVSLAKARLYFLCQYFDIDIDNTTLDATDLVKLNRLNITEKDHATNKLIWHIPLFAGEEIKWGWVAEWIDIFGDVNKARRGSIKTATDRMKKFFQENPEYRKEDVFNAGFCRTIEKY